MKSIIYSLLNTLIFVIIPALLILVIRQLSYFLNEKLVSLFGFKSQMYMRILIRQID